MLKQKISRFTALLAVIVIGAVGVAGLSSSPVSAQSVKDNSDNSIIKGGVSSASDLVIKARANNPSDLQAVFSKFNLTPDKYDQFAR